MSPSRPPRTPVKPATTSLNAPEDGWAPLGSSRRVKGVERSLSEEDGRLDLDEAKGDELVRWDRVLARPSEARSPL